MEDYGDRNDAPRLDCFGILASEPSSEHPAHNRLDDLGALELAMVFGISARPAGGGRGGMGLPSDCTELD